MLSVGDKVRRFILFYDGQSSNGRAIEVQGKVVYIHPEHRFYTVEIRLPNRQRIRTTEYFYPRGYTRDD